MTRSSPNVYLIMLSENWTVVEVAAHKLVCLHAIHRNAGKFPQEMGISLKLTCGTVTNLIPCPISWDLKRVQFNPQSCCLLLPNGQFLNWHAYIRQISQRMTGLACHVLHWIFCDVGNHLWGLARRAGCWCWLTRDMNWQNKRYTVSNPGIERQTAVTFKSQPSANLSFKMHWDMTTEPLSEKTGSAVYHVVSREQCQDVKQHESFMASYWRQ